MKDRTVGLAAHERAEYYTALAVQAQSRGVDSVRRANLALEVRSATPVFQRSVSWR